jgi:branched-subunit amino acid aminotransferase/4-amino-4-deoxychorismate lyase
MPANINPDSGRGVFETLLVVGGRPIELDAHLARLAASLSTLFDAEAGREARDLIVEEASGLELGRLRLTAAPRPDEGIALEVRSSEVQASLVFPPAARAVALRSVVVPGGLGAHKWADRALLARAETQSASVPLLLDSDDSVLEASRANIFAVREGMLTTPAADGRILPGVTRAYAIEIAGDAGVELREARLTREMLLAADEVLLTGAVRGIEPVGKIDGVEIQPGGELTRLLAGGLRRRWLVPE